MKLLKPQTMCDMNTAMFVHHFKAIIDLLSHTKMMSYYMSL